MFAGGAAAIAGLAVLIASGQAPQRHGAAQGGAQGADPAETGARLYAEYCASCHGAKLEGQPRWQHRRADGRLPAPPHDASGHTWHHPDAQLIELIKHGPTGLIPGYQSDMPGFAGLLTDDEIRAVLGFIKASWPPEIRRRQEARDGASERR
ncbi:MAG: cytochrome c [Acetobacteraceae bacterium]|nr:cytochrome c [Acetobacteraceae bacterium]